MRWQQLAELGSMGVSMHNITEFENYCEVCKVTEDTIQRVAD